MCCSVLAAGSCHSQTRANYAHTRKAWRVTHPARAAAAAEQQGHVFCRHRAQQQRARAREKRALARLRGEVTRVLVAEFINRVPKLRSMQAWLHAWCGRAGNNSKQQALRCLTSLSSALRSMEERKDTSALATSRMPGRVIACVCGGGGHCHKVTPAHRQRPGCLGERGGREGLITWHVFSSYSEFQDAWGSGVAGDG